MSAARPMLAHQYSDLLDADPQTSKIAGLSVADWKVWSTTARLVVTDPAVLDVACDIVLEQLRAVDQVANRFRADSELSQLDTRTGVVQQISPLLADLIGAALDAARATDGDVDPTVGSALLRVGYDRDISALISGPSAVPSFDGTGQRTRSVTVIGHAASAPQMTAPQPTWRQVHLNGTRLGLPAGVQLDLGATAKAWTADRCAALVHERLGTGVLVSLGGDIATAGQAPESGWQIAVDDDTSVENLARPQRGLRISLPSGGAVATSSTVRRRWVQDGTERHHIIDPRTGEPAVPVWRTVSVAAPTCLEANVWSTASVVRGRIAPVWLASLGAAARLVSPSGRVVTVGGWPG